MSLFVSHPSRPSVRLVLSVSQCYVYVHTNTPVTGSNMLYHQVFSKSIKESAPLHLRIDQYSKCPDLVMLHLMMALQ